MKRMPICVALAALLLFGLSGCAKAPEASVAQATPETTIKERLLAGVNGLAPSEQLCFEDGLTITGMGVNFSGDVTKWDDNFFWQAIERMTGVTLDIFWEEKEHYITSLSTMLLTSLDELPDILNASDFGVMDLADDGAVIPLDDYLDLIPNVVAAVGEDRMGYWRQVDGHIYTIPSVINVPGAQTMMVRGDWLEQLNLAKPQTWDEWVNLWRAIRDNDLNGNGDPGDEIPFASQYVSYEVVDGVPVMAGEMTESGFTGYRAAGCNISSLTGLLQEGAFMQCLFEGRSVEEMDDMTEEFYKGISVVNNGYFYALPKTYETPAYTKYRNALITEGVCRLRNRAIKGEITVEAFFEGYEALKREGLQSVIDEAAEAAGK